MLDLFITPPPSLHWSDYSVDITVPVRRDSIVTVLPTIDTLDPLNPPVSVHPLTLPERLFAEKITIGCVNVAEPTALTVAVAGRVSVPFTTTRSLVLAV